MGEEISVGLEICFLSLANPTLYPAFSKNYDSTHRIHNIIAHA